MTKALGHEAESDTTSNPLAVLKPLAVIPTNEHAVNIILGADAVTRNQRDAAVTYLNKTLGSSFKLEESTTGGLYVLHGCTTLYSGDTAFRALVEEAIRPEFLHTGDLKIEIARDTTRRMVGVECTLTATGRGMLPQIPELDENPPEVYGLVHEGSAIAFSLKEISNQKDGKLIGDALRVAKAFGVYVERPPTRVADKDPRARLHAEFNYVERETA